MKPFAYMTLFIILLLKSCSMSKLTSLPVVKSLSNEIKSAESFGNLIRFKSTTESSNQNSSSNLSTNNNSSMTMSLMSSKSKEDKSPLWNQLFSEEREIICRTKKQENSSSSLEKQQIKRGERIYKGNFKQKRWGYGPAAYLIDYLDSIFQKDVVKDFNKIWSEIKEFSNKDNDLYEDVFDIRKLDPTNKITELKKLNPNYIAGVYENSVNSVQIDFAMRKWGWFKVEGENTAKQFILDYDLGGDGRLTPREFFLGLIQHHKDKKILCFNCLLLLKKKIGAMFDYFDCPGEGYIKSEELWKLLPQVVRNEKKWNIFSIANQNNIRTDSINDFVIKNGVSRPGLISKEEFINGILLAYWDRHTTDENIINNDSRSLKSLRWDETGQKDLVAFEYMKEKELAEKLEEEEKQREKNIKAAFKDNK